MATNEAITLLSGERLYPMAEALKRAGIIHQGDEGRAARHPSTLSRWATRGVLLPGGGRVRLEVVRVGSRWMTSTESVVRFFNAQTVARTNQPDPEEVVPMPRTKAQRAKALRVAEAKLDELGV